MKKFLFLAAFLFVAQFVMAQDGAVIAWEGDGPEHNFGKIVKGVPVTHEFKFYNEGKQPVIITDVKTSCGCTTPGWSKDPIPPGGEGFVKATFNAANLGAFNKSVSVTANVEGGIFYLKIKGEVLSPEDYKKEAKPVNLPEKKVGSTNK